MRNLKLCLNLVTKLLILINLTLSNSSEARNVKHTHPSAVLVGTVYCDTCFQDDFSWSSHFLSGATVSVECSNAAFKKEVQTDDKGEFEVHLPVSISKHEKQIKGCQVRLVKSSEPHCAVASAATTSPIQLKSGKQGTRIFSAGFFNFKPLKQPDLCNKEPSITAAATNEAVTRPQMFFPPILPPVPLPPNPLQPPSQPPFGLPNIPGLPPLPTPVLPVPSLPPGLPVPPLPPVLPVPPLPPVLPVPPLPPVLPVPPLPPVLPVTPLPPVVPGVPPAKKVSP